MPLGYKNERSDINEAEYRLKALPLYILFMNLKKICFVNTVYYIYN